MMSKDKRVTGPLTDCITMLVRDCLLIW